MTYMRLPATVSKIRLRALVRPGVRALVAAGAGWLVFLAGMFIVMCQPPERFGQIMKHMPIATMDLLPFERMWNVARGGAARVGDQAPAFTLPTVDRKPR